MHIFTCKATGDEIMSDSYPIVELFGGFVFEVKSENVKKGGQNYGIQGEDGEVEDQQAVEVNNIIDGFKLKETNFQSAKVMQVQISKYLKGIIKQLPKETQEEKQHIAAFKKEATEFVKFLMPLFKELQFYTGQSYDIDGVILFAITKDGDMTPTFYMLNEGLQKTKV